MVEIEVELKLSIDPRSTLSWLTQLQTGIFHADFQIEEQGQRQLCNTYYDTPDRWFLNQRMGLRTRSVGDQHEQTLKTSGQVAAGLHQRPEYNVPLQQPKVDLSLFPAQIWPAATDIAQLAAELHPLFTTDFQRQQWGLLHKDGAVVELVVDRGKVIAGGLSRVINEVELELKSGSIDTLFIVAAQLMAQGGVRLANVSKAEQGYRLAAGQLQRPLAPLLQAATASASQASTVVPCQLTAQSKAILQAQFNHWQACEQAMIDQLVLATDATDFYTGAEQEKLQHLMLQAVRTVQGWIETYAAVLPQQLVALQPMLLQVCQQITTLAGRRQETPVGVSRETGIFGETSLGREICSMLYGADYAQVMLTLSQYLVTAWQAEQPEDSH